MTESLGAEGHQTDCVLVWTPPPCAPSLPLQLCSLVSCTSPGPARLFCGTSGPAGALLLSKGRYCGLP